MEQKNFPENEEVARLYLEGMSTREISGLFSVSDDWVLGSLKRTNTPRRSNSESLKLAYQRGRLTAPTYWKGKKQPPEAVAQRAAKISGSNHYLWKGGQHNRDYRKVIVKEKCENCGATEKLEIHHRDNDHYNNSEENLGVLCKSCHLSHHKKAYWAAYREGRELPKSNGPVSWKPEDAPRKTGRRVKMRQGKPKT